MTMLHTREARRMDKPQGITTYTILPPDVRERLDEIADQEKRSTAQQIALIVERWIEQQQPPAAQKAKGAK